MFLSVEEDVDKVATDFVDAYGSFGPGITETDITKLIALLEGIMDGACDKINSADSTAGMAIVAMYQGITSYCNGVTIGVSNRHILRGLT